MTDKYTWLDQGNERRNMSDREILDKCVDLQKSCLSDSEKKQAMDMLYKYKDAFRLRDEIRYLSKYRGRNRCYRQKTILY